MTRDNAWRIGSLYAVVLVNWLALAPVLTWHPAQLAHATINTLLTAGVAYLVFRVTGGTETPSAVRARINQKRERNREGPSN